MSTRMCRYNSNGAQNGASFPKDPNGGAPPVHFSSQNNPGGEFETTPQVSGDFLDYDPGQEDPSSMPGYRDAEFEIPLIILFVALLQLHEYSIAFPSLVFPPHNRA